MYTYVLIDILSEIDFQALALTASMHELALISSSSFWVALAILSPSVHDSKACDLSPCKREVNCNEATF